MRKFNNTRTKTNRIYGVYALVGAALLFICFSLGHTNITKGQSSVIYINGKTFETLGDTMIPSGFTVLDIGASNGGSSNFLRESYQKTLGDSRKAGKTLGLDVDPVKVASCIRSGHECIRGDATRLSRNGAKVKGSTMWHVLEHLPTCEMSRKIWKETREMSTLFSSFRGPAFDQKEVLRNAGFHRYYENWRGHTCHWDALMLDDSIQESLKTVGYLIVVMQPIVDSDHEAILPNDANRDSQTFDEDIHPPKPMPPVQFDETVYREMRAVAVYDPGLKDYEGIVEFETALAIRDVVRQSLLKEGKVYSCRFPGVPVNDKEECFRKFQDIQDKAITEVKGRTGS